MQRLKEERVRVKAKTKGLYGRSFLRTGLTLSGTGLILILALSEDKLFPSIGISIMCAALSAIGAGIYTLVKKGNNRHDFIRKLK